MVHFANDKAFAKIGNSFILTTLLAERVKDLRQGSKPLIDIDSADPVEIALLEIDAGKLTFTIATPQDE